MSALDEYVITPIEQGMAILPFGTQPAGRAAWGFAAGAAFAYFVRPSLSFDAAGNPLPWIVTDSSNPNATIFPYWAYAVLPGLFFGVFV